MGPSKNANSTGFNELVTSTTEIPSYTPTIANSLTPSLYPQISLNSVETPCIEVHITHPSSREDYRHISIISKSCTSSVSGFGLNSYDLALYSISISN